MRIGLDMANYDANRSVTLLALVTNDTDCIPAMKYARRAGLQVALVCVPGYEPTHELLAHCDFAALLLLLKSRPWWHRRRIFCPFDLGIAPTRRPPERDDHTSKRGRTLCGCPVLGF